VADSVECPFHLRASLTRRRDSRVGNSIRRSLGYLQPAPIMINNNLLNACQVAIDVRDALIAENIVSFNADDVPVTSITFIYAPICIVI
jgi:hypothetical protein